MKKNFKKICTILIVSLFAVSITSCSNSKPVSPADLQKGVSIGKQVVKSIKDNADSKQPTQNVDLDDLTWNEDEAPNYYKVVGTAEINKDEFTNGQVDYLPADKFGRPTVAQGELTHKMVMDIKKQKRPAFKEYQKPIGWDLIDNQKVNDVARNSYFWNKSHMVAYSLGGSMDSDNLITGTRTQNVGIDNKGGMRYTEIKAQKYLEEHTNGIVWYKVTNLYQNDNELLPRVTVVDVLSDDGSINEKVYVYNTASGYTIDYVNAQFSK